MMTFSCVDKVITLTHYISLNVLHNDLLCYLLSMYNVMRILIKIQHNVLSFDKY